MPWEHEIQIALPRSYGQGERRYPVLWVTDGSTNFDVAVETARRGARHVPEMIIVGVGAPPEAMGEFQNRRAYEFGSREPWAETSAPGRDIYLQSVRDLDDATSKAGFGKIVKSGGAADFRSFLIEEVLSERKYPSLRLSMRIFTAEDHGSVVPVDMYWGLRAVWSGSATAGPGCSRR